MRRLIFPSLDQKYNEEDEASSDSEDSGKDSQRTSSSRPATLAQSSQWSIFKSYFEADGHNQSHPSGATKRFDLRVAHRELFKWGKWHFEKQGPAVDCDEDKMLRILTRFYKNHRDQTKKRAADSTQGGPAAKRASAALGPLLGLQDVGGGMLYGGVEPGKEGCYVLSPLNILHCYDQRAPQVYAMGEHAVPNAATGRGVNDWGVGESVLHKLSNGLGHAVQPILNCAERTNLLHGKPHADETGKTKALLHAEEMEKLLNYLDGNMYWREIFLAKNKFDLGLGFTHQSGPNEPGAWNRQQVEMISSLWATDQAYKDSTICEDAISGVMAFWKCEWRQLLETEFLTKFNQVLQALDLPPVNIEQLQADALKLDIVKEWIQFPNLERDGHDDNDDVKAPEDWEEFAKILPSKAACAGQASMKKLVKITLECGYCREGGEKAAPRKCEPDTHMPERTDSWSWTEKHDEGEVKMGVARVLGSFVSVLEAPEEPPLVKGVLHVANRYVTTQDFREDGTTWVVGRGALVFPHPYTFLKLLQLAESGFKFSRNLLESWGPLMKGQAWKATRDKVTFLRSYCTTQAVDMARVAKEEKSKVRSVWKENRKGSHIEGFFATPIEIVKQLGDGQEMVVTSGKLVSRNLLNQKLLANAELQGLKEATASQSGHTDGGKEDSASAPAFVGFISPVNGAANLRVWDCSHDLVRYVHDGAHEDTTMFELSSEDEADYLQKQAPAGSMLQQGRKIPAKTLRIPKGESAAFLPTLMHAGSAIGRLATRISYRLHVYALLPVLSGNLRGFVHGAAYSTHPLLMRFCDKSEGGDHDL